MAKVGHIEVEVRPTVALESAVACVMILNLFLDENEEYRLAIENDGDKARWVLTDKPVMRGETPSLVRQRMRLADLEWAVRFMAPILLCSCCDGVSDEEWAKLCGILFDAPDAKFRVPEGDSLPCDEGGISADKCWECVSRNVRFNQLAGLEDDE